MNCTVDIEISKPQQVVWEIITDIENCQNVISGIRKIHILNKPRTGIVGLKWEETRNMFGKESTETMWITDAETEKYYCTRAESHGSVYITKLSLKDSGTGTLLTISFDGVPQTITAKILSFLMRPVIKNSIRKPLEKDLEDIKTYVEKAKDREPL